MTAAKSKRYQKSNKKQKTIILNEFAAETGFNRKYAVHLLTNLCKTKQVTIDGKPVKLIVGKARKPKKNNGGSPKKYGDDVITVLSKICKFFDYRCGKLLAPLIKLAIDFLAAEPEFGISGDRKYDLLKNIN